MKKKKLNFKKLTIAKLNNAHSIYGGGGQTQSTVPIGCNGCDANTNACETSRSEDTQTLGNTQHDTEYVHSFVVCIGPVSEGC